MAFSYAQLEGLWIKAGGDPAVAPIAAAIVFPESGGNPSALNPTDNNGTQSSFGLWQISNGTHSPPSPNWQDPLTNAQLAVAKYKGAGNSFSPWGTYGSGAYRQYLQGNVSPDMTAGGGSGSIPPDAQTVASGSPFDPNTWIKPIEQQIAVGADYLYIFTVLIGGGLIVLFGLILFVKEPSAVGAANIVIRTAANAVPLKAVKA